MIAAALVAAQVSAERLADLLDALARFGARQAGGIDRQALSEDEVRARRFLVERARAIGCEAFQDPAGNLVFRRPGLLASAPVATGSHIDTQPVGGKLDGAYGVCGGLEVLAALNDLGARTRLPIEVVAWVNEEGCRFAPGSMGSVAFVDPARLGNFLAAQDAAGHRYGDCLAQAQRTLGDVPMLAMSRPYECFIELHIEQGPVLEEARVPIGIVQGVQGVRWFRIRAAGRAAHAGTTPLAHRKDALRPLSVLMERLYARAESDASLRLTVGVVEARPGSINTIPEEALMTVDVRHEREEILDKCEALIADYCGEQRHGCELTLERLMTMPPTSFHDSIRDALRGAAESLALPAMPLVSGAFHDAVHLAHHCPTGMIFVPSRGGISHNSEEHTDAAHLTAGVRVLALALAERAGLAP